MLETLRTQLDRLSPLTDSAFEIWSSGGWAMIALAVIAFATFALGTHVLVRQRQRRVDAIPEETWRGWIHRPRQREGTLGELLDFVAPRGSAAAAGLGEIGVTGALRASGSAFEQLRSAELKPFERDLRVMKILVAAAPLVGLLGTVTGMLATFGALSTGSGGSKTMSMISKGISEALITTETGLVIAIPGLFFQYLLARRHTAYEAFLAHLETVCSQALYKRLRSDEPTAARPAAPIVVTL